MVEITPDIPRYMPPSPEDTTFDREVRRIRRIVDAMTAEEREAPGKLIDASRCLCIAAEAGASPHDVQDLIKTFEHARREHRRRGRGAS